MRASDQSIADVSRSSSACCRDCRVPYLVFGVWRSKQGMGPAGWRAVSDGRLWPDIAPRSAGTRFLDRQDVEMWGIGLRTGGVGNGMLVCVKGPGITERSDRVIDLQIFTDADVPRYRFR